MHCVSDGRRKYAKTVTIIVKWFAWQCAKAYPAYLNENRMILRAQHVQHSKKRMYAVAGDAKCFMFSQAVRAWQCAVCFAAL